ncbi:uncharacterized protein LOC122403616 [Colletes gigas]|uniref:uncharacterized protein LOC122403616 n=1 Tax=Colletes gigas TaxID=935657 RepID=UPI001C9B3194|nr:uncharacterized protein LOC122403616 [Colletes gigas]
MARPRAARYPGRAVDGRQMEITENTVTLRKKIFDSVHNLSHPSGRSIRKMICKSFVWPYMKKQIAEWACCYLPKHIEIPAGRFEHLHVDTVGPLPPSNYRPVHTLAGSNPSDRHLGERSSYNNFLITRFGTSLTNTTDQGAQFESQLFMPLVKLLGCCKIRTTAYHPAANGMIERWHRSLKSAISCYDNPE